MRRLLYLGLRTYTKHATQLHMDTTGHTEAYLKSVSALSMLDVPGALLQQLTKRFLTGQVLDAHGRAFT